MPAAGYCKSGLLLFACALYITCSSQPTAGLADSLKKDAIAVKRADETVIEIISPKKARLHYLHSYTILSSMGDMYATMYAMYDKFHKLDNVTGTLYDANGNILKKVKKSEMEDRSAEGAGTLVTDTRVKYYHFSCRNYPYTVTYEEDVDLDGVFMLPSWYPQPLPEVSVESATLVVKTPAGYPLRYKQFHYPGEPVITEKKGDKTYTWELKNRAALPPEPYSPPWYRLEPCVLLAPGDFEIEGYKGHLYTWNDMGVFINALWKGRDQLPEEAKQKVHALTDGLKDDHEKISVLYSFMQKNSHYVGIQLGIGGWQPFDAAYVYSKRFGDCKALSNYMVALLKEANINGNCVLIRGGVNEPALDTGFACSQFNHAIAVAYAGHDSIWLECTSQTLPAGYLGSFTADRDALLINETGGHVVHTPVYGLEQNQMLRTLHGSIDSSGHLIAVMRNRYTGMTQDDVHNAVNHLTPKEQAERVQQTLGLPNCIISNISYHETPGSIPVVDETFQLSGNNFATLSGSRMFISPGAFLRQGRTLKNAQQPRKNNVALDLSFQETDSVILEVPPGYSIETNLPTANFTAPFGDYSFHSALNGTTLTITGTFREKKGEYNASAYSRLVRFFDLVRKEDNDRLILVKNR